MGDSVDGITEPLPTSTPTKSGSQSQENAAAFIVAAIIGVVVIGFFIFLIYKMILKRREDAEKARNAEKLSKITGRPKKTVTFKDEVESNDDVLKNKYAEDTDSDEDSGIKIDLEENEDAEGGDSISDVEDEEMKFDIDEDIKDCLKIDIDVCENDEVKVDLATS